MVERRPDKTEVHGPIPCPPTKLDTVSKVLRGYFKTTARAWQFFLRLGTMIGGIF